MTKSATSAQTETDGLESSAPGTVLSPRKLLVDWANGQDGWIRQLAGEILASRQPLSDGRLDSLFAQFLAEKGLIDEAADVVPLLEPDEGATKEATGFVIERLEAVKGVNALAANQKFEFNPGLTILFGENGAGKTGYIRILKQLAAVRTAKPILPNVHDKAAVTSPEAAITYAVGAETKHLDWRGEEGIAPFTHVSIFDSPAVELHVDDDLTYVYTPSDLALFPLVNQGIVAIRDRLEAETAKRGPMGNPFLSQFTRGTPVYQAIETLGAASDVDGLKRLASLTEQEAEQLTTLRNRVEALQTGAFQAELALAKVRRDLYERLVAVAKTVQAFNVDAYNQTTADAKEAEAYVARLRAELLTSSGLPGDSETAWESFILGGEAYRRLHPAANDYPEKGDRCLYCQQSLGPDALALLRRYRDFANDVAQKQIEKARQTMETISRGLLAIRCAELTKEINTQRADHAQDEVLQAAAEFFAAVEKAQAIIREGLAVEKTVLGAHACKLEQDARARHDAAEELIADLSSKAEQRQEALHAAQSQYSELKDRIELRNRLASITDHVENAKWAQRAGQLSRRLPQLLRSATEVAKIASDQLLNSDFDRRFADECKALRAPQVGLEFPGRQGQAARRKTISVSHRPSEVLSEGEQKVIALADFLAESALRLTPAPLIFDDPVNSLDYRRIHEVADRVAELAADRQVIVFTHNIWFTTELLSRFEKTPERCAYYSVTAGHLSKGLVVAGTHPRIDTMRTTAGKITNLINSARVSEGEIREALVDNAYSYIRNWCEVVVELDLLAGVTERYRPNVRLTSLGRIKGAYLEAAIAVIVPIFEKACRIMPGHSQPMETLSVRPTLEELEQDWEQLQAARKAYNDAPG